MYLFGCFNYHQGYFFSSQQCLPTSGALAGDVAFAKPLALTQSDFMRLNLLTSNRRNVLFDAEGNRSLP